MLVCSCNLITDSEIRTAIRALLEDDPWQLIVPAKVYHRLAQRGRCCGCFADVADLIVTTTAGFHAERATSEADLARIVERLKDWQEADRQRRASMSDRDGAARDPQKPETG